MDQSANRSRRRGRTPGSAESGPYFVGYEEDGVMRVGGVADARAAEQLLAGWSGEWRVIGEVWIHPQGRYDDSGTFRPYGGGDESWLEGGHDEPHAERVYKLVDVTLEELYHPELDETRPNPHYNPEVGNRS